MNDCAGRTLTVAPETEIAGLRSALRAVRRERDEAQAEVLARRAEIDSLRASLARAFA